MKSVTTHLSAVKCDFWCLFMEKKRKVDEAETRQ